MFGKFKFLFFVLFIEGAAVMAVELMGAKLVAPFYGSSLYVWTATLVSTVLGLTIGYYAGGLLSRGSNNEKKLITILCIATLLVFALPQTALALIQLTKNFGLLPGICVTCVLLVLPPLLCFGMVGPIAVRLMSGEAEKQGAVAGTVYFGSTIGGIAATFVFGYWLIPVDGLRFCALVTGGGLAAIVGVYYASIRFTANEREKNFTTKAQRHKEAVDNSQNVADKGAKGGDEGFHAKAQRREGSDEHTQIAEDKGAKEPSLTKGERGKNFTTKAQRHKDQPSPVKLLLTKGEKVKLGIYLYAVLEGGTVMAVELVAARMLAPYFGASLFVWAAVIGCTLTGLAAGYFAGGKLADRYEPLVALRWSLLGSSLFLLLMHFTTQQLTMALAGVNIETATAIVSLLLVAPPLVFLGMTPTLLIRHITTKAENAGSAAGNVYAISSASGIIALVLFGFYIIPEFGLTTPSIVTSIIVGGVAFIQLISRKKYLSLVFILFIFLSFAVKKTMQPTAGIEIQHYSEGLLGQVMVADVTNNDNGALSTDRMLFVNRAGETIVDKSTGSPRSDYVLYVATAAGTLPEHAHALLLGLGGGSVANLLYNTLHFSVDVAELDGRIADVASTYFSLSPDVQVTLDDARHYLEQTDKKYDLIFFDVFRGDIPPAHVLSMESFRRARALLNKNGMIIVNFYGYLTGDPGRAGRSVYKTLCAAGLKTRILPTTGQEVDRNTLFVAGNEDRDFAKTRFPLTLYGKLVDVDTLFIENKTPGLDNAVIFTDDKPMLDRSVIGVANSCRIGYDSSYVRMFWKNGVPLFE